MDRRLPMDSLLDTVAAKADSIDTEPERLPNNSYGPNYTVTVYFGSIEDAREFIDAFSKPFAYPKPAVAQPSPSRNRRG